MTRIHFADLHLERSFGGLGMTLGEAERRRRELRAALERIIDLALKMDVDAVTVAGDLYEHERATAETGRFIAGQLRRLAPALSSSRQAITTRSFPEASTKGQSGRRTCTSSRA